MAVGIVSSSSALSALTNAGTLQVQQRIAAKVVLDQMEEEASIVTKIVHSATGSDSESGGSQTASQPVGSRVDFRA